MTNDERLHRLRERHEALDRRIGYMALQGQEQNRRIDKIVEHVESLKLIVEANERRRSG